MLVCPNVQSNLYRPSDDGNVSVPVMTAERVWLEEFESASARLGMTTSVMVVMMDVDVVSVAVSAVLS